VRLGPQVTSADLKRGRREMSRFRPDCSCLVRPGPPDGVSRSDPPERTATLVALAAAGRDPTDLTRPTTRSPECGTGGGGSRNAMAPDMAVLQCGRRGVPPMALPMKVVSVLMSLDPS
jgi:hypothetical protein